MPLFAEKYLNQVVYIEANTRKGEWLDSSSEDGKVRVRKEPKSNIHNCEWAKWYVRKGPEVGHSSSLVTVESMLHRGSYLAADQSFCRIKKSSNPNDHDWALWYLISGPDGTASFRSKTCEYFIGTWMRVSVLDREDEVEVERGTTDWSLFRIYRSSDLKE